MSVFCGGYSQLKQYPVFIAEGNYPANYHLVQEDSTAPPVSCKAVWVSLEDLWGYVLGCTCQRLCLLVCAKLLGAAKVGQFEVALLRKQTILRF